MVGSIKNTPNKLQIEYFCNIKEVTHQVPQLCLLSIALFILLSETQHCCLAVHISRVPSGTHTGGF